MRAVGGVLYWSPIGFLALNALYVPVGENRLRFGLLVPVALDHFGAWWPGLGYSGMALVAFGPYPALLVTRRVPSGSQLGLVLLDGGLRRHLQPHRWDGHRDVRRLHHRLHRPDPVRAGPLGDGALRSSPGRPPVPTCRRMSCSRRNPLEGISIRSPQRPPRSSAACP